MEVLSAHQQQENMEVNDALTELSKQYNSLEHKHRSAHKQLAENNHLLNNRIR